MVYTKYGIWENINSVKRDMHSCLYDLQEFKSIYEKKHMPEDWEKL